MEIPCKHWLVIAACFVFPFPLPAGPITITSVGYHESEVSVWDVGAGGTSSFSSSGHGGHVTPPPIVFPGDSISPGANPTLGRGFNNGVTVDGIIDIGNGLLREIQFLGQRDILIWGGYG